MNYEKEINDLKRQVKQLNESVLAMGKNNVGQVSKLDDTSNKVEQITPYKASKTAYIDDEDCVFENVPQGILTVSTIDTEGNFPECVLMRDGGTVAVHFLNPLEYVTTVSIVIQ